MGSLTGKNGAKVPTIFGDLPASCCYHDDWILAEARPWRGLPVTGRRPSSGCGPFLAVIRGVGILRREGGPVDKEKLAYVQYDSPMQ